MKNTIAFLLLLSLTVCAQAQVKFGLHLLSDGETYLVSLQSERDIPAPLNMASNVQVVLKLPTDTPFLAGDIQSQIPGVTWTDNAFAKQTNGTEGYGLCAFVMNQSVTKSIPFEAGVEVPLFTFKNLESGCVGTLSLPDNGDAEVRGAVARGQNFTQNITLLASRGNAFVGLLNSVVECPELSTHIEATELPQQLRAYPVPTDRQLTIEWENPVRYESLSMDVMAANGQHLSRLDLNANAGPQQTQLDVHDYPTGLYYFILKNDRGDFQQHKFLVLEQ